MAELPRYKAPRVRPETGGGMAQRATAQMFGTLADRISGFETVALKQYAKSTAKEAKEDAEVAFTQKGLKAEINNDMTVYGETYTNALTNMHKKKLSIDTSTSIQQAYNNNKENPLTFNAELEEIYKNTSELLPDHLKADYAIDFEANKAHYSGQVNNNRIKADKENDIALTNQLFTISTENATKAAREGNHNLALYEMERGIKTLDSSLEAGTINEEQRRKGVESIKRSSSTAMFKGVNDKNIEEGDLQASQEYIDAFRTSDPEGFDDAQRQRLADDMQGDLNRHIQQNTVVDKAQKAEASIAVTDATKIYNSGKTPENLDAVYEQAALVTPKQQHEFLVAEEAYRVVESVSDKTLPEQQAIINAIESDPEASRVEIEALKQAKKNLSDKMTLAEKDPYSLGVQDGLYEQTNPITPVGGIDNLPMRAAQSKLSQAAYGTTPKLFTDSEAQQFSAWLDNPTTSIQEKLDFIGQVELLVPNDSTNVYDQLLEKGSSVFSYAGSMVKKGDVQKAEKMLRGQMILREQPNVVPMDVMQWKFNGVVGNAMRYQGAGARKALIDGTTSYYAAIAEEEGELSKSDAPTNLVKRAVQEVSGGVGQRNDQSYFMPPGVTDSDDVDDWVENLTATDFEDVGGISSSDAVDLVNRGQLVSVGEGKYRVIYQDKILKSKDGTPFILEYAK